MSTISLEKKTSMKLLFIFAMEGEAQPFIDNCKLVKQDKTSDEFIPCVVYHGIFNGIDITLLLNGKSARFGVDLVGTDAASLTAYFGIKTFRPDLIINAGTAGGFQSKGACVGDAYVGTECYHHDKRIGLPGFDEWTRAALPCYKADKLVTTLGLKRGTITTSNQLDHVDIDDVRMAENGATIKEMEAASIAHVAELAGVPFLPLKVITDIVDNPASTAEQFMANFSIAAKSLQEHLVKLIDFIANKKIDEI